MEMKNHRILLAARPVGMPRPSDWSYAQEEVRDPGDGEVLIQVLYISLDPAMRGWMSDRKSYVPPVAVGDVMRALGIGRVVASKHPKFAVGDHVSGMPGAQEYAISDGNGFFHVDPRAAPLPVHLSALGMPGMTAYFGLLDTGQPKPGETVVVSAAAGAVGAVAGQIAKIKNCRVVGIAGGEQKCRYIKGELGFDEAIDYRHEEIDQALRQKCPNGIDVYFDNVGGGILNAALTNINRGARIVICGAISQYNNTGPIEGPGNYLSLLVNRAAMKGMLVTDYFSRYPEARREIAGWMQEGRLKSREHIIDGLENFPEALAMLFKGENFGKLEIRVANE
ncbi:MAG: NADP-dependent oxidoreductase [Acidobacteria bacterium]|nr:NADP-dependent oxidoreductase [Acidobacteriota bacterium]